MMNTPPKVVGIIQARMNSSRLPGKMLEDLCGFPIIQWVLERCKRSKYLDEIVLATTNKPEDNRLIAIAKDLGIKTFRGEEHNVLNRYLSAASFYDATHIVRVCADNPLVSYSEIDRLIQFFLKESPDYAFNHVPRLGNNYPDGLGAEILSSDLLHWICQNAYLDKHKEHVTLYIWENMNQFNIKTISCPEIFNNPEMKLDVDTKEDLHFMRDLCKKLTFESTPSDIFIQWTQLQN